ncbi:hypothetical protein DFQ27_009012 [Actinomortierella ambigua]|uniref:D-arabinono-1,4-lactone oxidase n=1 Tax=Actinomortierella ambigua TaxID=1343610 RepID=A0A9P6PP73_9FUNG|nr:hypothetical protein DFQ27_009012 [Actinomortierella ambigua]
MEQNPTLHAATAALGTDPLVNKQPMQTHMGIQCMTAPTLTNWGGNQTCQPKKLFYPTSVEDCQAILKEACQLKLPVRCMGIGHSFSRVAMNDDGYMLSMTQMRAMQPPRRMADLSDAWVVTVQAGVTVRELDQMLRQHNPPLALATTVSTDNITVGGMTSVGSVGVMTEKSSVSDLICELTLLNSSGELCHFSEAKDSREFSAACCSLGLMGIVCDITLKLIPMTDLRVAVLDSRPDMMTILAGKRDFVKKAVHDADGTQLMYWPDHQASSMMNPTIWMKQYRWTDRPLQLAKNTKLEVSDPIFKSFKTGEVVQEIPDAMHFSTEGSKITLVEAGVNFKCDDDLVNVVECLDMLIKEVNEFSSPSKKSISIEMRIVRASSKMMSPIHDMDPTAKYCCINFISLSGTQGFDQFACNMICKIMNKYHAIPPWSKQWENIPEVKKKMADFYGDRVMQFDHIRRKYDTHGIFVNKSFQGLFKSH